eukprot:CAMPEP_0174830044 /NCGR_PEP_ID=MMETSP1114-20130205/2306_1 /TAXON_ID=312471 /ORGANISM="Neobodo designis, Strain CCAP 1951/1" /LENGTH=135 /DNA_ID=CAMNT_0016063827 /DNA_START=62 /DNA_END=469 /DNA_ORIENTATION=-
MSCCGSANDVADEQPRARRPVSVRPAGASATPGHAVPHKRGQAPAPTVRSYVLKTLSPKSTPKCRSAVPPRQPHALPTGELPSPPEIVIDYNEPPPALRKLSSAAGDEDTHAWSTDAAFVAQDLEASRGPANATA